MFISLTVLEAVTKFLEEPDVRPTLLEKIYLFLKVLYVLGRDTKLLEDLMVLLILSFTSDRVFTFYSR